MISIRNSVNELEQCHNLRQLALDCYVAAIRNIAFYAIDLEEQITSTHRKYLESLILELASGEADALVESRSSLRGLLRDYRDKAAEYINNLREQLAESARALEEIMTTLAQSDGDHDNEIRNSLKRVREISNSPACAPVRGALLAAADTIEHSVEEINQQHQLTISQFQVELRMLHKRIDGLEAAAMLDSLSKLFNRAEMEDRIRAAPVGTESLLLMRVSGLRTVERQFTSSVAAELAGAFGKRLRNSLPADSAIGRWSDEGFIAKTALPKNEAISAAKWIAENLSGYYACLLDGKTVRPNLQIHVAVLDRSPGEPPDKTIERAVEFFGSELIGANR